ncbi:hypothetical protein HL658_09970 [Azospirillum sp. RWY-5-1]|uniref:Uncharacterized protein n=1 Tax=Azospirillum oleiclasticum TaxID=2735135 RepID=A0ABX2T6S7_9PROT|nr:hypothetical protein [Azospirillum oleiclasticum]NYZ12879.1 hypothetical protein [Azospirillum oleiclasticum]NYZ20039.1 hypothetical protein [Azospirillum oleiclasticum]
MFAPPEQDILIVFDAVTETIAMPAATRAAMRKGVAAALGSGDPRKEERFFHRHLAGVTWIWPAFTEWHDRFAAAGHWPYLWPAHAKGEPAADREKERRKLLGHVMLTWVSRLGQHRRRIPGWTMRLMVTPPDDAAPGWAEAAARFDPDSLVTWPPFYPGDRTGVIAERPRR